MINQRNGRYDVVVVGGGAGGMSAAVAAARMGAKVLLVERYGFLGGAAANSLVLAYCGFFQKGPEPVFAVRGIGADLLDTLSGIGQDIAPIKSSSGNWIVMLDPEAIKYGFDQITDVVGLDVLLHSRVIAAVTDANGIAAVTITDHAGSYEVAADAFVDASGEATLSSLAGLDMLVDSMAGDRVQPASLPVRLSGVAPGARFDRDFLTQLIAEHNIGSDKPIHRRDGGVMLRLPASNDYWWMTIDLETGGLSGTDLSVAERQARREAWRNLQLLQKMPGFEKAFIAATGPQIGIRETRRPRSREDLTRIALEAGVRRGDGIGRAAWPMEVHEGPGQVSFIEVGGDGFADIPIGAIQATALDNLFLAGRVAGADRAAYGSLRVMGTAFATGHAAGIAAALRSSASFTTHEIRTHLASQGALI